MDEEHKPLKILAKDLEDLQVFAVHLQDALLPITGMSYDESKKVFQILANRFCWEKAPVQHEGEDYHHRVHSQLCFNHVNKVQQRGLDQHGPIRNLNLMTIEAEHPHGDERGHAVLHFSGGGELKIDFDKINCHLGDLEEPWMTKNRPTHIHEHLESVK